MNNIRSDEASKEDGLILHYMNLAERIRLIISENSLKQKEFAKSINVTESYISKLLRGESGVSDSTATLISSFKRYLKSKRFYQMIL